MKKVMNLQQIMASIDAIDEALAQEGLSRQEQKDLYRERARFTDVLASSTLEDQGRDQYVVPHPHTYRQRGRQVRSEAGLEAANPDAFNALRALKASLGGGGAA